MTVKSGVSNPLLDNAVIDLPVLFDTFAGANGTLITARTANTKQSYTVTALGPGINASYWNLFSNVLIFGTNTNVACSSVATANTGISNYRIAAKMAIQNPNPTNCQIGIVFRYVDASNFWVLKYVEDSTQYRLAKIISGSETTIGTYNYTATLGFEPHDIVIRAFGSAISVRIDGTQRMSTTDTDLLTATRVGYFGYLSNANADAGYIDLFQVTPVKNRLVSTGSVNNPLVVAATGF